MSLVPRKKKGVYNVDDLAEEYENLGYDRPGLASIHALYTAIGYTDDPAPGRAAEEEGQEQALGRVKTIQASPLRPKRGFNNYDNGSFVYGRSPDGNRGRKSAWDEQSTPARGAWQPQDVSLEVYRRDVVEYLLHRMPRPRLQQIMMTEFTKADGGPGRGKGYLTHQELVRCLKNWSGFGVQLSQQEIVQLLHDADVDQNGQICYNE